MACWGGLETVVNYVVSIYFISSVLDYLLSSLIRLVLNYTFGGCIIFTSTYSFLIYWDFHLIFHQSMSIDRMGCVVNLDSSCLDGLELVTAIVANS